MISQILTNRKKKILKDLQTNEYLHANVEQSS